MCTITPSLCSLPYGQQSRYHYSQQLFELLPLLFAGLLLSVSAYLFLKGYQCVLLHNRYPFPIVFIWFLQDLLQIFHVYIFLPLGSSITGRHTWREIHEPRRAVLHSPCNFLVSFAKDLFTKPGLYFLTLSSFQWNHQVLSLYSLLCPALVHSIQEVVSQFLAKSALQLSVSFVVS